MYDCKIIGCRCGGNDRKNDGNVPDLDSMVPTLRTNVAYGGRWALPITCRWLSESRKMVGDDFPLIGTNGARDGYDIARMMLSGASGVQITSSIFTNGFEVISKSLLELLEYLENKGISAKSLLGRLLTEWRPMTHRMHAQKFGKNSYLKML